MKGFGVLRVLRVLTRLKDLKKLVWNIDNMIVVVAMTHVILVRIETYKGLGIDSWQ